MSLCLITQNPPVKHADKAADRVKDKAEETRVRRWLRSTWKLLTQHIVIFCHKFVDHYLTYSLIFIPPPPRPLVLVYPHIARPVTCSRAPYVLILKNPQFLVIILLLMSFLLPNIHIDHPVSINKFHLFIHPIPTPKNILPAKSLFHQPKSQSYLKKLFL